MKECKKIIALLLSALMIFTMVSNSVVAVAENTSTEKTQVEEVENTLSNTFDTITGIINGVHNLVGSIMSMLGKECVFCDEVHRKADTDGEDTQEPTEPETPPSEPEVPVEPEQPTEPEEPTEPEKPETDEPESEEPAEDKIGNVFDSIGNIFDSIHNLVGGILAIFGKECPFCDKVHGDETEEPVEEGYYTVTFNLNYEGAVLLEKQTVKDGEYAVVPEIEEREGYQFIGWYTASGVFDFSTPIKENIELTARWFDENDNQDSDNDGLNDSLEEQFGTDPTSNDTDNDGVSDYNELNWLNSDPSNKNDGSKDYDEDGLTNAEEDKIGTNPAYYDSDYDYLSDYDEIYLYNTNPLNNDTDSDGVIDGVEIQNGSDPLMVETEFVTTIDLGEPDETNSVVASATVVTDGEGAGTLDIEEVLHSDNHLITPAIPGYLGAAFDFSTEGNFLSATITFSYDTSLGEIGEDFQPRIYYLNEETGLLEELPNQNVENGKVSVEVEHFSTYILLNKVEFESVWNSEIKPPEYDNEDIEEATLDMAFVIDYSLSMDWNDPSQLFKKLSKEFISKLRDDKDKATVVKFIQRATKVASLTTDKNILCNAIDSIAYDNGYGSYSGTNGSAGLKLAIDELKTSDSKYQYIIFITDGEDNSYSYSYDSLISEAIEEEIVIYTIGMGSASESVLKKVANETKGKYYHATTSFESDDVLDLGKVFDKIDDETIDYVTDSNLDGISDYYTNLIDNGDLFLSNGVCDLINVIDLYGADCADWDGDGLLNGEEITIKTSGSKTYIQMYSNPCDEDSDGDGINDYVEVVNLYTNPLKITKSGATSVENLIGDDLYVYVEQVNDDSIANEIAGFFDWQKTGESKETFINYFYDYASQSSLDKNAEAREKLADKEEAWKRVEAITNIVKLGKSILDLGTDLNSYDSSIKGQITKYENKHKTIKSLYNKKEYKKVISEYSEIKDYNDALKGLEKVYNLITKEGVVKKSAAFVAILASGKKLIKGLEKTKLDLGKKVNSFSNKYQTFMGSRPTGDITYGTAISVGLDTVEIVTEIAELNNLYGKLQANSEAFNEYIELIEYISNHGNDKDYIKVAAGDIIKIVLDKTNTEYYKQLAWAMANNTADNFINIAISIVGDFCPYVKVAEMVINIVKVTITLTGMTAYAKALVKSQCIDAISDGCIYYLSTLIDFEGELWFSYSADDEERLYQYLTQLAQSRIVGEEAMCTFLKQFNLINFISKIISGTTNEELDACFDTIIKGVYNRSDNLGLVLSSNLPRNESTGGGSR